MTQLTPEIFLFLKELKENNHRDWMDEHRKRYKANEKLLKQFYAEVMSRLNETDVIAKTKVFRINRDIRFSNNKTPYNSHRSVRFIRSGEERRGSYYLRIEPGNSGIAGGFFQPEPADLLRIRKEFEADDAPIRNILSEPSFSKTFGNFVERDPVKIAPKGFKKDDPNIDLIRHRSFFVAHSYTDDEVLSPHFQDMVVAHYKLLRPFFDYMSEVLTTNLNGESLLN
ncbi:MAG: TIGR02453 family protein [Flavobacteriaceae bacterium]|nr:TIGR02453 family protein [Flavobacteriaceae bacterium]|tara:strand:+ start:17943 stop:18620 length:678 start_codon:yes stop_codon:yes gene_type:complete